MMARIYVRHGRTGDPPGFIGPLFEEIRILEERGRCECKRAEIHREGGKRNDPIHTLDCPVQALVEWRGAFCEVAGWRVINPKFASLPI